MLTVAQLIERLQECAPHHYVLLGADTLEPVTEVRQHTDHAGPAVILT